jgi:hypothetical protein
MRNLNQVNTITVQTNLIPTDLNTAVINETARSIALFYKNGKFTCQTFFTRPVLGEINVLEGIEQNADVHIRAIQLIGPHLLMIRLTGEESQIHKMCADSTFYNLMDGILPTLNNDTRSRRYLEVTDNKNNWNCIISLDKRSYNLLSNILLNKTRVNLIQMIVLGDRLLGLTEQRKVVMGQLRPDILGNPDNVVHVTEFEPVNRLGAVTLLGSIPNTDEIFLVTIGNTIYNFSIWGEMLVTNPLDENVKEINSINFNHTRTIMATTNGIYEMDVLELPNMVRTIGMPRQIVNPHLRDNFQWALYVDDPQTLGIQPAMGIFAKTKKDKVMFF